MDQEGKSTKASDQSGILELVSEAAGPGMMRLESCGSLRLGEWWLGLHQKISWHREASDSGELGCKKKVGKILIEWRVQMTGCTPVYSRIHNLLFHIIIYNVMSNIND